MMKNWNVPCFWCYKTIVSSESDSSVVYWTSCQRKTGKSEVYTIFVGVQMGDARGLLVLI